MPTAKELIAYLDLKPLPMEGGYYREMYRSTEALSADSLPSRYGRDKSMATAIFYLLTPDTCSAMHLLPTDEVFHFYLGDPVRQLHLHPDGSGKIVTLGTDLLNGQRPQVVVPRGVWQGAKLAPGGSFALMGTTMAPGFDFDDYKGGQREELAQAYPEFAEMIEQLTPLP